MSNPSFDLTAFVERSGFSRFLVRLVILSWLVTFFDGFDMNAIAYVAPALSAQFAISRPTMGNIFSIGIVGTMIGGFLFGYLADRIGRRPTIIAATSSFALLTLALAAVQSLQQLAVLRFLDGIAVGGMLPVAWALNIEYAPRRFRSTVVTIIMLGYSLGVSAGGPLAAWLIPAYGWPSMFALGGILSLLATIPLVLFLPESVKFLAAKGRRPDVIRAIARKIDPTADPTGACRYVVADEPGEQEAATQFRPALLFKGKLLWITPLLWLGYIASSMAVYFLATWMPLLAEAIGLTHGQAAAAGSASALGGAVGGLLLMRFVDRKGAISIAAMPLMALPVLVVAGTVDLGVSGFLATIFLMGMFIVGAHTGLHSIAGIFYPSAYRSNGAGWATSIAKIGSILGPWIGGQVLSTHMPPQHMFLVLAACPAIVACCVFVLGRLQARLRADAGAYRESAVPLDRVARSGSLS